VYFVGYDWLHCCRYVVVCICTQMTASKDFIVHLVATPSVSSEEEDVDVPSKRWLSVDAIDEQYIVNHARQVQMNCSFSVCMWLC